MSYSISKDRFRGCMLGLAAGDALGTNLEFERPGAFQPIEDMIGGGPFRLNPGQWTDDTSMALCLAASLIETGRIRPRRPDAAVPALAGRGLHVRNRDVLRHWDDCTGGAVPLR